MFLNIVDISLRAFQFLHNQKFIIDRRLKRTELTLVYIIKDTDRQYQNIICKNKDDVGLNQIDKIVIHEVIQISARNNKQIVDRIKVDRNKSGFSPPQPDTACSQFTVENAHFSECYLANITRYIKQIISQPYLTLDLTLLLVLQAHRYATKL